MIVLKFNYYKIKKVNKWKINIVSDVVCPWCIIGYKRLEQAIKELNVEDKIEIEWQPFELNPNIAIEGENIIEHMNYKYGMKAKQVNDYQEERKKDGANLGFKYDYYDDMKIVNTRDAHILINYAKDFGKQNELQMRLFSAHFGERKIISNRDILAKEVETVGLNVDEAMGKLDGIARDKIIKKEEYWRSKGINSVPSIIFNNTSMINGAYGVDEYKKIILKLLEEQK